MLSAASLAFAASIVVAIIAIGWSVIIVPYKRHQELSPPLNRREAIAEPPWLNEEWTGALLETRRMYLENVPIPREEDVGGNQFAINALGGFKEGLSLMKQMKQLGNDADKKLEAQVSKYPCWRDSLTSYSRWHTIY